MRFKLILLVGLAVALAACSKKSAPAPQSKTDAELLVGKWYYEADTVVNYTNGVETSRDNSASQPTDYQQYNANGTALLSFGEVVSNLTYTLTGNVLTLKVPQQPAQKVTIRYISTTGLYLYSETADTDKNGNIYKTEEAAFLK